MKKGLSKKSQIYIIIMLVFFLTGVIIPISPINLTVVGQETYDKLPTGVETYLIHNYSDYKLYGLDYIKDLPKYNSQSLTEFHMPIVYKIPSTIKMDAKKFIKEGTFETIDKYIKNFNERLIDSGYTVYGNLKSDEYFMIDYWIKVKASDKPFSIDFIPTIELDDRDYKLEKYAWWNSSYLLMKQITINHSYIDNDLINFPVLVYSNDTTMLSKMDDGDSLRFTNDANDTEYYFEIEKFNDTTEMIVWVNISRIDSSVDTKFNMYYNNTDASDGQNAVGTWDSNYIAVYHMDDLTTSTVDESTSNNNDGTKDGVNQPVESTGKIGKGQLWTGSYHIILPDTDFNITPDLTIETWVKVPETAEYRAIYSRCGTPSHYHTTMLRFFNDGTLNTNWENPDGTDHNLFTTSRYDDNTWKYIAVAVDSQDVSIYVNTSCVAHTNSVGAVIPSYTTGTITMIGTLATYVNTQPFDGVMDEFRISDITRNNSWFNTSFHSQNRTTGFLTFGSELEFITCPDIIYTNETPTNGDTDVYYLVDNLSVTINVSFGNTFNYTIHCSNGNTTSENSVSNGTYSLDVCCLEPDTLYYWYVNTTYNVTCGWENVTYNFTTAISGCQCIDELTLILKELQEIKEILEGDEIIELEINQWSMLLAIGIFVFLFAVGYNSEKRSGGLFLLIAGFTLFYIEALATLNGWLSPVFVLPFLSPLAIYIVIIGAKKFAYGANLKTDTKQK